MTARTASVPDDRRTKRWRPCGSRPCRSMVTSRLVGGWILDVDIRKFFDTLDHAHLRELLQRRIRDGVLLRLIGKWLNAGVLEDGNLSYPEAGSPQGGVISPLLSNVFLHYVLDEWFEQDESVCDRGSTSYEGPRFYDPLRRRLRHGIFL